MNVGTTNTGKKFLLDRARHVVEFGGKNYYVTAAGNIVRDDGGGNFTEITKEVAKANILLMPYPIAFELFPEWFAANPETI